MQLMDWELTADGAMLATCRNGGYSKKALENLFDRKWTVASGVGLIGIAITLIAVIGSVSGGVVLGTIGSAILIHRLFKRPDILTNLRVDPWLVNILKEEGVKKLPIVRDLQSAKGYPIALRASKAFKTWCGLQYPGGKDITVYMFQYKIHKLDGEKVISEELFYQGDNWGNNPDAYTSIAYEHQENQMIRCRGYSEFNHSQLALPEYLYYFGKHIANPLVKDITDCYHDVVERIAGLCSGERLSLLENRRRQDLDNGEYVQLTNRGSVPMHSQIDTEKYLRGLTDRLSMREVTSQGETSFGSYIQREIKPRAIPFLQELGYSTESFTIDSIELPGSLPGEDAGCEIQAKLKIHGRNVTFALGRHGYGQCLGDSDLHNVIYPKKIINGLIGALRDFRGSAGRSISFVRACE